MDNEYELPLGLSDAILTYGWNAREWKQVSGKALLKLKFTRYLLSGEPSPDGDLKSVTLLQGGMPTKCNYPDGATIKGHSGETESSFTSLTANALHIATSLDEDFSESIGMEGLFSESASFSMKSSSKLDTQSETRTFELHSIKLIYDFVWDKDGYHDSVTQEFLEAAAVFIDADDPSQDDEFFGTWGTHFLHQGHFGGFWTTRVVCDASEISSEFSVAMQLSMNESSHADLTNEELSSTISTSFYQGKSSKTSSIRAWRTCSGGIGDTSTYEHWNAQVDTQPELLATPGAFASKDANPTFKPISELLSDTKRSGQLKDRITKWLGCVPFAPAIPMDRTNLKVNQLYPNVDHSHRLILGFLDTGDPAYDTLKRNSARVVPSVTSALPAIAGAAVDASDWNTNKNVFLRASFMAPVTAGTGFVIRQPTVAGNSVPRLLMYDVSKHFGFDESIDLQDAGINTALQAGLAVACISSDSDGTDAKVYCEAGPADPLTRYAAAQIKNIEGSNLRVGTASFVVPIQINERYKLWVDGTPVKSLKFFPLRKDRSLVNKPFDSKWVNAGEHGTFINLSLEHVATDTFSAGVAVFVSDINIDPGNLRFGSTVQVAEAFISYRESWYQGIFHSAASTFVPPGMMYYIDTRGLPAGIIFMQRIFDVVGKPQ